MPIRSDKEERTDGMGSIHRGDGPIDVFDLIKSFWTEGIAAVRGTKEIASIYLRIQLGVKKEKKFFTRNVYARKESTLTRMTSAEVEQILNLMLTEILDDFFSNPY